MENMTVYWARIVDGNAIPISLMGMAIVFLSLLFISIFIGVLPHILNLLGLLPDADEEQAAAKTHQPDEHVVAAIGAVLMHRLQSEE